MEEGRVIVDYIVNKKVNKIKECSITNKKIELLTPKFKKTNINQQFGMPSWLNNLDDKTNPFYEEVDDTMPASNEERANFLLISNKDYYKSEFTNNVVTTNKMYKQIPKNEVIAKYLYSDVSKIDLVSSDITNYKVGRMPPFQIKTMQFYGSITQDQILKYIFNLLPKQPVVKFLDDDKKIYGDAGLELMRNVNIQHEYSVFNCFKSLIEIPVDIFSDFQISHMALDLISSTLLYTINNVNKILHLFEKKATENYVFEACLFGRVYKYLVDDKEKKFYGLVQYSARKKNDSKIYPDNPIFIKSILALKVNKISGLNMDVKFTDKHLVQYFIDELEVSKNSCFSYFIEAYKNSKEKENIKSLYDLLRIGNEYKYNLLHR